MPYTFKTSAKRSDLMRKIKSSKTSPEILLQNALRKSGIKYKKNYKALIGNPDIVLIDKKIAIFVDGEFWHGYRWRQKKKRIKANRLYWISKIENNIKRDRRNTKKLKKTGWRVIRFWQHQINEDLSKCIKQIKKIMMENPQ